MKRIVIGTAGHIDHGKTRLVKALTGVDTDRLTQEKERGITIELGFTHLDLADDLVAGFIDVPGHERFVRTMIAGASGMDLVLLVVAADEGVMPQTREHLEICELLGVDSGLIVINKTDLVDAEMAELAAEEARDAVVGTFLEGRDVYLCSAVTGEGIEELKTAITELARQRSRERHGGAFRLPVDRVFTMKGFGTVVTGTTASGKLRVGDTVELWPSNETARVRGLQVHGEDVDEAFAGQRTAVNLQGVDKDAIARGDVLAEPGTLAATYMVDVEYRHLESAPEKLRPRQIRFLSGTAEALGTIHFIGTEHVGAGDRVFAQVRLESPVAVRAEDRFVIRTYSPMITIGGGRVLDPLPKKHRKRDPDPTPLLDVLAGSDLKARTRALVEHAGHLGVTPFRIQLRLPPIPASDVEKWIGELVGAGDIERLTGADRVLSRNAYDHLAGAVHDELNAFHQAQPAKPGMLRGELTSKAATRAGVGGKDALAVLDALLDALHANEKIVVEGSEVRLSTHRVVIEGELAEHRDAVERLWVKAGLTPPTPEKAAEELGLDPARVREVIGLLARSGELVRTKETLYFHTEPLDDIRTRLVEFLESHEKITTVQFKELAGVSRKYMIPLLEYFDASQLTMRVGEARVLRKRDAK